MLLDEIRPTVAWLLLVVILPLPVRPSRVARDRGERFFEGRPVRFFHSLENVACTDGRLCMRAHQSATAGSARHMASSLRSWRRRI